LNRGGWRDHKGFGSENRAGSEITRVLAARSQRFWEGG
jgi:hypothetical protein